MWNVISQSGLASAVLDFTNELSPLIIGLLSVVWLSAGMLVFTAVRHYLSQKTESVAKTASGATDHRDAA